MSTMDIFPIGSIIMWASANNIPDGWSVCNGDNGTPNLVEKYPIGTSNSAKIGQPIGTSEHSHTVTGSTSWPSEGHPDAGNLSFENQGKNKQIHRHGITGETNSVPNNPPSTYVIFIMKTHNE